MYNLLSIIWNFINNSFSVFCNFLSSNSNEIYVNLFTGLIEIIITVGIIDTIIRLQDRLRWKPVKGLLLSDLLNISDMILFEFLPKRFRLPTAETYKFGNSRTTVTVAFTGTNVLELKDEIESNTIITLMRIRKQ